MHSHNAMATAALVLGIASIILCSVFYISLPCGAIAIICFILSRDGRYVPGRGKIGLTLGIAGVVLSLVLTVSSLYYVLFTETGRSYLEYYYRVYTGDTETDVNGLLDELFPFLAGDSEDSGEELSDTDDSDLENPGEEDYMPEDSDTDDGGFTPSQPEEYLPYDDSSGGKFI